MLRLSKLTDYGIVLLAELARDPFGETQNARELAEVTHLPPPVVSKVLKTLARDGVLTSHRGIKGGYGLARPPERISVAEVIAALEGPVALTECGFAPGSCEHELSCSVRSPWERINRAIGQTLERVSLADLVRPPGAIPLAELGIENHSGASTGASRDPS